MLQTVCKKFSYVKTKLFQTFAWNNLTYIFDIVVGYVPGEITLGQMFSEPIPEELHDLIIQKYHDYYSPRLWNNKKLGKASSESSIFGRISGFFR